MQGTHLDSFYELLKEKKELKVAEAAKLFNISENLVLNWAKILEAGNLAVLYTPGIGRAVIRINEEIEPEIEEKIEREKPTHKKIPKEIKEEQPIQKTIKDNPDDSGDGLVANELTKEENRKKISAAKQLIHNLRQKKYDDKSIRDLFIKQLWPEELVDSLLK